MKKLLVLSLLLILLIIGCSKNGNDTPKTIPDPNAMKYTISGIADLKIKDIGDTSIVFGLSHTGGKQEKLELSITDLPENLTGNFEPSNGVPSFATTLKFSAKNVKPGTYTIKLKAKTASDSVKAFDIKLDVEHWNCATSLSGTYNCTFHAYWGPFTDMVNINANGDGEIIISYPFCTAKVNCANWTIDIPLQVSGSDQIQGSGSFTPPNIIDITYKYYNGQVWSPVYTMHGIKTP